MPMTVFKDAGAGAGSDTTLTIRNFQNLTIDGNTPADVFNDIAGDEDDAILLKMQGASMTIGFDWVLMEETTSVVSGAGGSVTTAVGQQKYLYDTFMSKGVSQILDTYTLTIDYGGAVTFVRTGVVVKITCTMAGDEPVTFNGHMDFHVGTVF